MKELDDQAAALQARFDGAAIEETLDDKVPSLLVAVNGGLVKITQLGNAKATGTVLLPLTSTADAGPGSLANRDLRHGGVEPPRERPRGRVARAAQGKEGGRERLQLGVLYVRRQPRAGACRNPGRSGRLRPDIARDVGAVPSDRRGGGDLPRGVRAEEPDDRADRGEHQQSGRRSLDRVRAARTGGVSQFLRLPRSAPLVGGLVLALLVLPTIIIASRAALKAVPPSIKEAALGVGASHQQAIFHHVLPLAMPGIMTGTIIGMAHALGETAPLLMIGMVAFIVEVPDGHYRCGDRPAGSDLSVVGPARDRVPGQDRGRDHGPARVSFRHERHRNISAQNVRAPVVSVAGRLLSMNTMVQLETAAAAVNAPVVEGATESRGARRQRLSTARSRHCSMSISMFRSGR